MIYTVTSDQAVAFNAQRELPEKGVFEDKNSDSDQSSLSSYEGSSNSQPSMRNYLILSMLDKARLI